MLTKVTAYSQWPDTDPLIWNVINPLDTDLFEVRNIDGLGPVKADINTSPLGSVDGTSFLGSNVGQRNIVFTIGFNPDWTGNWNDWTLSKLRRFLDQFFMPKQSIRLVFETHENAPVEISGYVEGNDPNIFSKDPESQISIICPEPQFISVDYLEVDGMTDDDPISLDYKGTIETGFGLKVMYGSGANAFHATIWPGTVGFERFTVAHDDMISETRFLSVVSRPREKSVGSYGFGGPPPPPINLLPDVTPESVWPTLKPGIHDFSVQATAGVHHWYLTYKEHFGSL